MKSHQGIFSLLMIKVAIMEVVWRTKSIIKPAHKETEIKYQPPSEAINIV